jgi:hypothetical protein
MVNLMPNLWCQIDHLFLRVFFKLLDTISLKYSNTTDKILMCLNLETEL